MTRSWMTTGEVARELGVSVSTVRYWIYNGYALSAQLPSGRHIIRKAEVERLRATTAADRWRGAPFTKSEARARRVTA